MLRRNERDIHHLRRKQIIREQQEGRLTQSWKWVGKHRGSHGAEEMDPCQQNEVHISFTFS